jgi:hypothetical protein
MSNQSTRVDLWVFRDGRKSVTTSLLIEDLAATLRNLQGTPADRCVMLDALIRAGELESAFSDQGFAAAQPVARLTDALAWHLVHGTARVRYYEELLSPIRASDTPQTLQISPPEGFSYYGLNPADFIELARSVCRIGDTVAIVGIRSIGITLSAVVAAALSSPDHPLDRISVRPSGHPYDRVAGFSAEQIRWIEEKIRQSSRFVVVDEGPGRSGSTFLSVAEALVALGVAAERLILLGTRQPQLGELCAKNAGPRWSRFQFSPAEPRSSRRFQGCAYIGSGEWRKHFISDQSKWPACWPQMERSKFISPDGKHFLKFEGMGRIGEEVRTRAQHLAKTGFGCPVEDAGDGYSAYRVVTGRPLEGGDLSLKVLERVARYCSMRASDFRNESAAPDPLADMLNFNVQQEFGIECGLSDDDLTIGERVVADGHMQPYEWLLTRESTILKSDAVSHGDDHFFPGPISIAWDLAGIIIEWELANDARQFLLNRFREYSGQKLDRSLDAFCLAYSVFRMSLCKMAIPTADHLEKERLRWSYAHYRKAAKTFIRMRNIGNSWSIREISDEEYAV